MRVTNTDLDPCSETTEGSKEALEWCEVPAPLVCLSFVGVLVGSHRESGAFQCQIDHSHPFVLSN
jgi:hypothetical protein